MDINFKIKKKMNKINLTFAFLSLLLLTSCATQNKSKTYNSKKVEEISVDNTLKKSIIIDVRTLEEWEQDGHADCSVNYPMDQISTKIEELKKYNEVILVCRSGGRAGSVKSQLEAAGLKNVKNLGAWQNVKCKD